MIDRIPRVWPHGSVQHPIPIDGTARTLPESQGEGSIEPDDVVGGGGILVRSLAIRKAQNEIAGGLSRLFALD
jgi:hypothetical protein